MNNSRIMSDQKEKVRGFIIEHFLFGQGANFQDAASFLEQGIMDSTGVLELVAFLESSFGIKVSDDELVPENLDSVDLISAYLDRKQTPTTSS
jgi:acyl carrier protein